MCVCVANGPRLLAPYHNLATCIIAHPLFLSVSVGPLTWDASPRTDGDANLAVGMGPSAVDPRSPDRRGRGARSAILEEARRVCQQRGGAKGRRGPRRGQARLVAGAVGLELPVGLIAGDLWKHCSFCLRSGQGLEAGMGVAPDQARIGHCVALSNERSGPHRLCKMQADVCPNGVSRLRAKVPPKFGRYRLNSAQPRSKSAQIPSDQIWPDFDQI